jgi:hypothetical protein
LACAALQAADALVIATIGPLEVLWEPTSVLREAEAWGAPCAIRVGTGIWELLVHESMDGLLDGERIRVAGLGTGTHCGATQRAPFEGPEPELLCGLARERPAVEGRVGIFLLSNLGPDLPWTPLPTLQNLVFADEGGAISLPGFACSHCSMPRFNDWSELVEFAWTCDPTPRFQELMQQLLEESRAQSAQMTNAPALLGSTCTGYYYADRPVDGYCDPETPCPEGLVCGRGGVTGAQEGTCRDPWDAMTSCLNDASCSAHLRCDLCTQHCVDPDDAESDPAACRR